MRSREIELINCKVDLRLILTKYCVLTAAGNDNTNGNPSNIVFTIKDAKLYVIAATISGKDNQKISKPLYKGFESLVY